MEPTTATIQTRTGDITIACPANVGPLGAFRTAAAAHRCLAGYADVAQGSDVTAAMVFPAKAAGDRRMWHVAALAYNRPVNR